MKKEFVLVLSLALAACGGGGGGSSPASPATNQGGDAGGTASTPKMKTGVFSDSLVQGLNYAQGNITGKTGANGEFTYDANSSQPVVFSVGALRLGAAYGASLVTPLDLDTQNGGVDYNRGINVTRLLIALDTDSNSDNGIQLSAEAASAAGNLPFDLPPQAFDNDSYVQAFEVQFNITNLPDASVALAHLNNNQRAAEQLAQVDSQVTGVGNVELNWNSNLRSSGLLEQVKADDGEQLFLFVKAGSDASLSIDSVIYLDAAGNYLLLTLDENGDIDYMSVNGKVSKIIANMDGTGEAGQRYIDEFGGNRVDYFYHNNDIYDIDHYSPQRQLMRVDIGATTEPVAMQERHISQIDGIQSILGAMTDSTATTDDAVKLAGLLMHDAAPIICSEFKDCGGNVRLSSFLDNALADSGSAMSQLSVFDAPLNPSAICVAIPVSGQVGVCGGGSAVQDALTALLAQVGGASQQWGAASPHHDVIPSLIIVSVSDANDMQAAVDRLNGLQYPTVTGPGFRGVLTFKTTVDVVRLGDDYVYYHIGSIVPVNYVASDASIVWYDNSESYFDPVLVARNRAVLIEEVNDLVRILQNHSGVEPVTIDSNNFYLSDGVGGAVATPADAYVKSLALHQGRYIGPTPKGWIGMVRRYAAPLYVAPDFGYAQFNAAIYDSALTNSPAYINAILSKWPSQ